MQPPAHAGRGGRGRAGAGHPRGGQRLDPGGCRCLDAAGRRPQATCLAVGHALLPRLPGLGQLVQQGRAGAQAAPLQHRRDPRRVVVGQVHEHRHHRVQAVPAEGQPRHQPRLQRGQQLQQAHRQRGGGRQWAAPAARVAGRRGPHAECHHMPLHLGAGEGGVLQHQAGQLQVPDSRPRRLGAARRRRIRRRC